MRLLLISLCVTCIYAFKEENPMKTKKYKCMEISDDEEVRIVPRMPEEELSPPIQTWKTEDSQFKTIGSVRMGNSMEEIIEVPKARKKELVRPITTLPNPPIAPMKPIEPATNIPRDKDGRPLVLSPQHCQQVQRYAKMYGVSDVQTWVKHNCSFARMYLPSATCEEIDILVASCYKMKYLKR